MLLDAGAVLSGERPGSLSALHHAAYDMRPDVVDVLLAQGAEANEWFSPEAAIESLNVPFGGTALHLLAASLGHARDRKVEMDSKPDLFLPGFASAAEAAARRAAICDALVRAGANVEALTTPPAGDSLINYIQTPLVVASRTGDAAVIKALLRAGATVDAVEQTSDRTALHFAALGGHTDAIYALAAGGADLNKMLKFGPLTPLASAVVQNHHAAVRALLELGADSLFEATFLTVQTGPMSRTVDATTRALVEGHRSGVASPAHSCSLPDCDARRRLDYDDKRLMMCPCKVRRKLPLGVTAMHGH